MGRCRDFKQWISYWSNNAWFNGSRFNRVNGLGFGTVAEAQWHRPLTGQGCCPAAPAPQPCRCWDQDSRFIQYDQAALEDAATITGRGATKLPEPADSSPNSISISTAMLDLEQECLLLLHMRTSILYRDSSEFVKPSRQWAVIFLPNDATTCCSEQHSHLVAQSIEEESIEPIVLSLQQSSPFELGDLRH